MFTEKYPYTDYNEYNLDWCIKRIRDLSDEWAATHQEWKDVQTEWTNYKNYIDSYFENLDLSQEVSDKIDQMAADGYFADLFNTLFRSDLISEAGTVTSAWIADNLLQETGYVIDTSLTVANAAADAAATGKAVTALKNDSDALKLSKAESIESISYISKNLYILADATQGYYLNGTMGTPTSNANYCYTDYIEINSNEYEYVNVSNGSAIYFYDENKTLLDPANRAISNYKLPASRPAGTKYCRFNFGIAALNLVDFRTKEETGYYIAEKQIKKTSKYIQVGSTRTIQTLKAAVDYINTQSPDDSYTILLDEGIYNVMNGFSLATLDNTFMGLVLPDNVYIEGVGNPDNVRIIIDGISFPANVDRNEISALNFYRNNGLKNLTIESKNVRYGIHDDDSYRATNPVDNAVQIFENVKIINSINSTGDVTSYCIGIGAKRGQHFIFKNCTFENRDNTYCSFLAHNGTTAENPVVYDFDSCLITNNGSNGLRFTTTSKIVTDIVNIKGCKTNKPVMLDRASVYTDDDTAFKFYGYGNSSITFNVNGIVLNPGDTEMML